MLGRDVSAEHRRYIILLCLLSLALGALYVQSVNTPCQIARLRDDQGNEQVNRITDLAQCQRLVDMLSETTMGPEARQTMQNKITTVRAKRMGAATFGLLSVFTAGLLYFRAPRVQPPTNTK